MVAIATTFLYYGCGVGSDDDARADDRRHATAARASSEAQQTYGVTLERKPSVQSCTDGAMPTAVFVLALVLVVGLGSARRAHLAGDRLLITHNDGAEDFAVALVDEAESDAHAGRRFTVAN
mgnify:CR=1 FL=1